MIFKYADKTLAYERDLRGKVNKIDATIICKLVNQTRDFVQEPEGVSQLILGIYPGSDREEIVVNILTEYIYQLVKNAHGDNWDKEARKMYSLFRRNAETRALAGYIFEDRIHEVLQQGNSWKATKLEGPILGRTLKTSYTTTHQPFSNGFMPVEMWISLTSLPLPQVP